MEQHDPHDDGLNPGQLTALVPASLIASPGSAAINVLTSDGAVSLPRGFSIYARLQITTAALPALTTGANYNFQLTGTGGISPYSWTVSGLPQGLAVNSHNGAISGVTQTDGSFGVTVTLTDGSQQTATAQFPLRVERLIPPSKSSLHRFHRAWSARLIARLFLPGVGLRDTHSVWRPAVCPGD